MNDTVPPSNAGIHFPPPFIYVAGIAIGWGLHLWHPLSITAGPSWLREAAGFLGIVLWLALFLSALLGFRRARTTLIPNQPASALVTHGPYRITRNPMYLSLVMLYAGVTLLLNSWWPFILLPLVILVIDRAIIAREERYLASAFPTEYEAYTRRVRRWL